MISSSLEAIAFHTGFSSPKTLACHQEETESVWTSKRVEQFPMLMFPFVLFFVYLFFVLLSVHTA